MSNMFAPGQCITLNIPPVSTVSREPTSMAGSRIWTDHGPGFLMSRIDRVPMSRRLLASGLCVGAAALQSGLPRAETQTLYARQS